MFLVEKIDEQKRSFKIMFAIILIILVGYLEYIIDSEVEFSLFFLAPVSFASWFIGQRTGLITSLISAGTWLFADLASGHVYQFVETPFWNTLIRFSFFIVVSILFSSLRKVLDREALFARTDGLTGAVNSRQFHELAQVEMDRLSRYKRPFTLVYIDLDNFKQLNDKLGHVIGDDALKIVVDTIKKHIRKTDVVARLGGDEFALLLAETNEEMAKVVVSNFEHVLLSAMKKNNWPITFSIGVVTCLSDAKSINEVVHHADELMYSIKRSGKNSIKYDVFEAVDVA